MSDTQTPQTQTETVSLEEAIIPLLENGVEPTVIARAWNLDALWVNSLPASRRYRIADETEISESVLQLMTMALEEGRKLLIEGTPTVKMRFIHSLLSIYIKNFSSQAPKELEEMREEFLDLLTSQRDTAAANKSTAIPAPIQTDAP